MKDEQQIDHALQKLYETSDEDILEDLDKLAQDTSVDDQIPVSPDSFQHLWQDIEGEQSAKPGRRRKSWKKAILLAAVAGLATFGFCFAAIGQKSYFYRARHRYEAKNNIIFNNDSNLQTVNSEEEAYAKIEEELGIKPLKLNYVPKGMVFTQLDIGDGSAVIRFEYRGEPIYLSCHRVGTGASVNYTSDQVEIETIENKWTQQKFTVREEKLSDTDSRYEAQIIIDGTVYSFFGKMGLGEFEKIVEKMTF